MSDRPIVVIGDPALNRTVLFAQAARAEGVPTDILSYQDVFASGQGWRDQLVGRIIRLESPGRDFEVERALLKLGEGVGEEPQFSSFSRGASSGLQRDPGLIFASRQWYRGWERLLRQLGQLEPGKHGRFMNAPADIAVMFDKVACHARLSAAGVPVPPALAEPQSFDHLRELMRAAGRNRVFLKPTHGSGAAGVVALEVDSRHLKATTAIELVDGPCGPRLYSTNRVRVEQDSTTIRRMVDALCRERLHIEAWLPKAGLDGRVFDVRVVVIKGRAGPTLLRLSNGPLTNLHLGAQRGDLALLERRAGPGIVSLLHDVAEEAMACFPDSFSAGVDLLVTADFRRVFVLEVNAFGDLLEHTVWHGADTYTWEIRALLGRGWPPSRA